MFNVTRPTLVPACLTKGKYNEKEVLDILKPMFHEKCYLCERDDIHDVEIEHFIPHKNVTALKFDWNNLYYSCSRCNSIKSSTHINLLDCTDKIIEVGTLISCKMPSAPADDVQVQATKTKPTAETQNTVTLLNHCYNLENTALRGISRESLMEQMWDHYTALLLNRSVLRTKKSPVDRKKDAEQTIQAMLDVTHPFAIFWRWYYLSDNFLTKQYPHLRVGF